MSKSIIKMISGLVSRASFLLILSTFASSIACYWVDTVLPPAGPFAFSMSLLLLLARSFMFLLYLDP